MGAECGHHASYTFYKGAKYQDDRQQERWRVLAIGQFFFVKIWPGSDLVSVAELQLLWEDKVRSAVIIFIVIRVFLALTSLLFCFRCLRLFACLFLCVCLCYCLLLDHSRRRGPCDVIAIFHCHCDIIAIFLSHCDVIAIFHCHCDVIAIFHCHCDVIAIFPGH